jgi:hypothetical protein
LGEADDARGVWAAIDEVSEDVEFVGLWVEIDLLDEFL